MIVRRVPLSQNAMSAKVSKVDSRAQFSCLMRPLIRLLETSFYVQENFSSFQTPKKQKKVLAGGPRNASGRKNIVSAPNIPFFTAWYFQDYSLDYKLCFQICTANPLVCICKMGNLVVWEEGHVIN